MGREPAQKFKIYCEFLLALHFTNMHAQGTHALYSWYAHNAYHWGSKNLMHYDTYARPHMSHRGDICDICQNCDMTKYSIQKSCFLCNITNIVCSMCWTHRTKACLTSGWVATGCHWCELPYLGILITYKTVLTGRSWAHQLGVIWSVRQCQPGWHEDEPINKDILDR